jgi:methanethiol oxidase
MIENGLNPEDLLGRKFGHHLNFWSMSGRTLTQRVDLDERFQGLSRDRRRSGTA